MSLFLQMKKPKSTEVKQPAQNHTPTWGQVQDSHVRSTEIQTKK